MAWSLEHHLLCGSGLHTCVASACVHRLTGREVDQNHSSLDAVQNDGIEDSTTMQPLYHCHFMFQKTKMAN